MATKKKPAAKAKAAPKKVSGLEPVHLDPDLPLLPGNSGTFVARQANGQPSATLSTDRGEIRAIPSNTQSGARVSRIIETYGAVTVTFFEDGKPYASGTFGG